MLAYVFWHRPAAGVEREDYEEAQRRFHAEIGVPSACFALAELPFASGAEGDGYEDWYLVEDWTALGALNEAAVDGRRRPSHDRAAAWREPPAEARWLYKRPGEATADLLTRLGGDASIWQRQMVLGPAPEFCAGSGGEISRRRVC